jgi:ribosomal protein S18 acetylase RimI-like enzyme
LFIYNARDYDSGVSMHIRSISYDDVQGFIECYIQVFGTLYDILPKEYVKTQIEKASRPEFYGKLLKEVDDNSNILLVSLDDENIIGMAWGNVKEDGSSWLSFMGVVQAYRRLGVGRALLIRFIEECLEKGSRKISLDTHPYLVPAIQLYESMGFVKEGFVKNPFGLELILYSKNISPTFNP